MSVVIDASAVLAIVFGERGADIGIEMSRGALLGAVNLDEVLHKSKRRGIAAIEVEDALAQLEIHVRAFEPQHARLSAELHQRLQGTNTSFADRACLAFALAENALLVTADRAWPELSLPLDIRLIR